MVPKYVMNDTMLEEVPEIKDLGVYYYSLHYLTNMSVKKWELECGPMPNVMAALPNIGGALCSMPQSLADTHYHSGVQ